MTITVIKPGVPVELTEPKIRKITRRAFRNRFTMAEKKAMYESPVTEIKILLDDVAAANYIDLDSTETILGVSLLDTVGVIETSRVAEILADGTEDEQ